MFTYFAMLRGINVGGAKKVRMDELRVCCESLGFKNVRTYIQSGNVIFEHQQADTSELAEKIRRGIRNNFGFGVTVVIRTKEEMLRVIKNTPFTRQEEDRAHVTFLSVKPGSIPATEIEKVRDRAEKVSFSGREVYLYCPNGYGKTKLSNSFFEKQLKVSATTRNWRTIVALSAMARS
jgi:uncharacterized protein (DUF1697 family)